MGLKINTLLTPHNLTKTNNTGRIKYIVIHYVGALGDAKANCQYYASQYIGASAHYYVGFNGDIWQSVLDGNTAWHCGASSYVHPDCRNSNSIGIELCVRKKNTKTLGATDKDWYFEDATIKTGIALTKELMKKYNIPANRVIRHYDVTGKICPNPFVYDTGSMTWSAFKAALTTTRNMRSDCTYKVQTGDTLSAIAKDFGITLKCLRKGNTLTSDTIKVNQVLKLYYWKGTLKSDAPMRSAPGSKKPLVKKLKKGTQVYVCGSKKSAAKNKWYKVWDMDAKKFYYMYGKRIKKLK